MSDQTTALTIIERVEQSPVVALLEANSAGLLELLPDAAAVARFKRVVIQAIVKNPDLMTCTPESVIACVFEAAAAGWEPTGSIGGAYMVPFKTDGVKRAQLIPDYRGIVRLVTKAPSDVLGVEAFVVKEGDEFSYELGTSPVIRHTPSLAADRSARATTHAYAVAQLRNGHPQAVVEDRAGIERLRARGRSGDRGPWATDWDEMAKTKIVKRLCKLLPIRPEIHSILAREDDLAAVEREQEVGALPEPAGPTKADRLAARLAPSEAPTAAADPAPLSTSTPAENVAATHGDAVEGDAREVVAMTTPELVAALREIGIGTREAAAKGKELWPEDQRGEDKSLTDEQRGLLFQALTREVDEKAAAAAL